MNILIIGCGFLGMQVARLWSKRGHHITATTRHLARLKELSKYAQKGVILKGADVEMLFPLVSSNDVILVTVAADDSDQYESTYLQMAKSCRHLALETNSPRHLIYTSSTSVYGDHKGHWVDEESPLLGQSEMAKILIETEEVYLSLQDLGWTVSILRLSELYGPSRTLSKKFKELKGRSMAGLGDLYTNMVHSEDAAAAIDYTLKHHLEGIYNVTDDDHMTRQELFDALSKKFSLPAVHWDPNLTAFRSGNKRVSNHKIKGQGFSFHHAHRVLD